MNLLLTGHEGYVGSSLHARFIADGHHVTGWGRRDDITRITRDDLVSRGIDHVIHTAAAMERSKPDFSLGGADETVNVQGTRALVNALVGTGIGLIHLSTKDVYGSVFNTDELIVESHAKRPPRAVEDDQRLNPQTAYAKTKLMGEFYVSGYSRANILRITSCYTDYDHPRGNWITRFGSALREGKPITLHGDGKQMRDLLHADDLARLCLSIIEGDVWGETLNVGGGPRNLHSVREVANHLVRELAAPSELLRFEAGAPPDTGFLSSNRRAKEKFGWEPQILFSERLPTLVENLKLRREAGK